MGADGILSLANGLAIFIGYRLVIQRGGEQCTEHGVIRKDPEEPLGRLKVAVGEHVDDVVEFRAAGHQDSVYQTTSTPAVYSAVISATSLGLCTVMSGGPPPWALCEFR